MSFSCCTMRIMSFLRDNNNSVEFYYATASRHSIGAAGMLLRDCDCSITMEHAAK